MNMLRYAMLATCLTAVVLSVSFFTSLFAQQGVPQDPTPAAISPEEMQPVPDDGMEVQTSGPVHEGFASPLTTETPESIVVGERPPEPIDELPPEQRPEGQNVVWIPGYFAWDEGRKDFLWMSGFWRDVPPGRVWVSGYWTEAADGWQWVPGFWTAADQGEVTYLPQPPETVEAGPSIEQPSSEHFWVPGHWSWLDTHYGWRPGYWSRIQPNWVWIPAHYVWCPNGYVFVDGYWDFPPIQRGILFAPVYFQPTVYQRPYYYTPSIVWSTSLLTRHLWVRPSYYHYYFGDYYNDRYAGLGFRPWYLSFTFGRVSYDPLFSYYRWYHRHDRDWGRGVRDRYDYYRRNEAFRPPRTYREQQRIVERRGDRDRWRDAVVAAPISQIVGDRRGRDRDSEIANVIDANFRNPFRFDRVAQQERRQIARQSQEMRNVVRQRRELETRDNTVRVEPGERKGARKGEDARVRRPAARGLDISNVAQAMGASPGQRGAATKARERDRGAENAGRARDRAGAQAGRRAADELRDAARGRDAKAPSAVDTARGRPDAAGRGRGPDLGRPDRGRRGATADDLARPGRGTPGTGRPDSSPDDAARPGRGRPDAGRAETVPGDIVRPDRGRPDLGRPGVARPDLPADAASPDVKGRGRGPGAKGADRDAKAPDRGRETRPPNVRPDITRPNLGQPDRGARSETRPPRDSRTLRPPTTGAPDVRQGAPPSRGRGSDRGPTIDRGPSDRGPSGDRGSATQRGPSRQGAPAPRGNARPDRSVSQPGIRGLGSPSALTRQPPDLSRERAIPRGQTRSPLTISPRLSPSAADPSRATRPAPSVSRQRGTDSVAPLRLGGPRPAPRAAAPRPEVRARPALPSSSARGRDRSISRGAAAPSARAPSGESRGRDRAEGARRQRERK